jgi:hypothetical protein
MRHVVWGNGLCWGTARHPGTPVTAPRNVIWNCALEAGGRGTQGARRDVLRAVLALTRVGPRSAGAWALAKVLWLTAGQ